MEQNNGKKIKTLSSIRKEVDDYINGKDMSYKPHLEEMIKNGEETLSAGNQNPNIDPGFDVPSQENPNVKPAPVDIDEIRGKKSIPIDPTTAPYYEKKFPSDKIPYEKLPDDKNPPEISSPDDRYIPGWNGPGNGFMPDEPSGGNQEPVERPSLRELMQQAANGAMETRYQAEIQEALQTLSTMDDTCLDGSYATFSQFRNIVLMDNQVKAAVMFSLVDKYGADAVKQGLDKFYPNRDNNPEADQTYQGMFNLVSDYDKLKTENPSDFNAKKAELADNYAKEQSQVVVSKVLALVSEGKCSLNDLFYNQGADTEYSPDISSKDWLFKPEPTINDPQTILDPKPSEPQVDPYFEPAVREPEIGPYEEPEIHIPGATEPGRETLLQDKTNKRVQMLSEEGIDQIGQSDGSQLSNDGLNMDD